MNPSDFQGTGFDANFSPLPRPGATSPMVRAKWRVTAGLIPGKPIPELTKEWAFNDGVMHTEYPSYVFTTMAYQAAVYAESLQNPSKLNWVHMEWIWY